MGFPVLTDRFDPTGLRVGDGDKPQRDGATVMGECDDVRRIEREARRRQAEDGALAAGPGFHERAAAATLRFLGRNRHREGLRGNPRGVDGDASRLDESGVGRLVGIATREGREARPGLKVGVCGEHGGDPRSVRAFHAYGLDYVSCSPFRVPIARLAAARAALDDPTP